MDLVHVVHRRLVEVHSFFVQEFIGLEWEQRGRHSDLHGQRSVTRSCTAPLMNTCCASPLEGDSPSSWRRDSGVCPPGSNISHCPSQTSFSFPAGHRGGVKGKDERGGSWLMNTLKGKTLLRSPEHNQTESADDVIKVAAHKIQNRTQMLVCVWAHMGVTLQNQTFKTSGSQSRRRGDKYSAVTQANDSHIGLKRRLLTSLLGGVNRSGRY